MQDDERRRILLLFVLIAQNRTERLYGSKQTRLMLPRDECGQRPLNEWLRVRAGATSIAVQVR